MTKLNRSDQVSVYEVVFLQVLHPFTDVLTHEEQRHVLQSSAGLSQKVKQRAVVHELCHNADGPLGDTHAVQLNQFRVTHSSTQTQRVTLFTSLHRFWSKSKLCYKYECITFVKTKMINILYESPSISVKLTVHSE